MGWEAHGSPEVTFGGRRFGWHQQLAGGDQWGWGLHVVCLWLCMEVTTGGVQAVDLHQSLNAREFPKGVKREDHGLEPIYV